MAKLSQNFENMIFCHKSPASPQYVYDHRP